MKTKPIQDPIADGFFRPSGGWVKGKTKVYIAVGRPRPEEDQKGPWICPLYIERFTNGVRNVHGVGPLDSLLNAMNLLRQFFDLNTVAGLAPKKTKQPIG